MISEDDKIIKEFREKFLVKRKDSESVNFKNRNEDTLAFEIEEFILQTRKEDREEIKRVLEGLKGKERKIKKIPDILLGDSGNFNIAIKQVSNEGYNQAIPEFNKKINEAIKNL